MKARNFDPRKLDMGAFIESGEALTGQAPVSSWPRIVAGLAKDADLAALPAITWTVQGRQVPQRVGGPQLWLDIQAQAHLAFECQRCLHAVVEPVSVDGSIRFVKDEAAAAELDADSEDDVLALSRQFDVLELIEDELIMAHPLVPRHAQCPVDVAALMAAADAPLPDASQGGEAADPAAATSASGRPNPFAVLASLKKGAS